MIFDMRSEWKEKKTARKMQRSERTHNKRFFINYHVLSTVGKVFEIVEKRIYILFMV